MATTVRQSDTDEFAQCGMSRATLEATGCRHRATTCSISPQRPPGQHANKQQSTNTPTKLAVLMAIAMRRYNIVCIAQWRRSRASLEATGCHHRESTCSGGVDYMAPKWRRMHSISLCFFSCASLFSLYDILRVPINLGGKVSVLFREIYQV